MALRFYRWGRGEGGALMIDVRATRDFDGCARLLHGVLWAYGPEASRLYG